jgi:group I intron endonuclease
VSYGIIYKATGPGGKVYVGQTTKTLKRRKRGHAFRTKKGDRRSDFHIALLESGFDSFVWEEIDRADSQEELDRKEREWIAHYKADDPAHGYNQQGGGVYHSVSEKTRRKISESNKGKHSDKHHTEETRRKISEANKGEKNRMFGRHHTPEAREKMSEANKGKPGHIPSQETRQKLSEALKGNKNHLGKRPSAETRRKMSEAAKRRCERARENGRKGGRPTAKPPSPSA